jgi:pimeloyl-ACP methyl ester carboxylesterase
MISGTEDKITPISLQRKLAQKYANKAELKVIEGACHWTIGGSYFPKIKETLFEWLNKQNALTA